MLRSLLALTVRTLREDTRSYWPHVFRLLFAAFMLATLAYSHLQSTVFSAAGLSFFTNICWLNFLFITVGAVSLFATPITEEKEEATLGLLRMAGLGPVGLLLGKSTTRLWGAVLILAIQFPFTLLSITLGGVLWHQIVAAYIALVAYLVLVSQLGLLCSVICLRSSSAAGLCGIILGGFLLLPFPFQQLFSKLATQQPWFWPWQFAQDATRVWWDSCIWVKLSDVMATGFSSEAFSFQVWSNLGAAGVLFLVSCATFDYFTREHLTSVPARGALFRFRSGAAARWGLWRWFSPGRTWNLPILWKEFHFTAGGFAMIIAKMAGFFVLIVAFTVFALIVGAPSQPEAFGQSAIWTALVVGAIELAIFASRIFREEIRWQTYSALMMLPTSVGGLAWSKVFGCLLSWFPALFWLAVGIAFSPAEVGEFLREGFEEVPTLLVFLVLHYIVFLHLVVWMSLILKWGALPLSFIICYPMFWPTLIGCVSALRVNSQDAINVIFGTMDFGCLMLIVALQAGIWQQMHAQSAKT